MVGASLPSVKTARHSLSDAITYAVTHAITDAITHAITHAITYAITHAITDAVTDAVTHAVTYAITHRRAFSDSDTRIGGHRSGSPERLLLVAARFRNERYPLLH